MGLNALEGYIVPEEHDNVKWDKTKGHDKNRDGHDNRNNNRDNRNNRDGRDNRNNDYKKDQNQNRQNNNNHHNNHNNNGGGGNPFAKRMLFHIFNRPGGGIRSGKSTDDIRKLLNKGALDEVITDLHKWRNKGEQRPEYVINALMDPLFVGAFNKKTIDLLKEFDGKGEEGDKKSKKISAFYSEINSCLFRLKKDNGTKLDKNIYNSEIVKDMIAIYSKILSRGNSKLIGKLTKKVLVLTEEDALNISVIVAGGDPERTLYNLNNYLYYNIASKTTATAGETALSKKDIKKLYKLCYGEERIKDVLLTLMLERNIKSKLSNSDASHTWSAIDEYLLESLNALTKKEITKILYTFAKKRQVQESAGRIIRRLGDSRSIHADDYPTLTNVFTALEEDDITLKIWFRNN